MENRNFSGAFATASSWEYLQRARKDPAASPLWRWSIQVLQKSGRRIIIISLCMRESGATEERVKRKGTEIRPRAESWEHGDIVRAAHTRVCSQSVVFGQTLLLKSSKRWNAPGPQTNEIHLAPWLRTRKSNFIRSAKCISRKIGNNTLRRAKHAKLVHDERERKSLKNSFYPSLNAAYRAPLLKIGRGKFWRTFFQLGAVFTSNMTCFLAQEAQKFHFR